MALRRAARLDWQMFYQVHLRAWVGSLVLLPLCLYFAFNHETYTLLDAADLVIHEAGHFFFHFFGDFMHVAGGTLLQLLLPAILVAHFWVWRYRFGVQLSLFWLGQNALNVSVYAADARARALPLLGGDAVGHDWWNMLRVTGLLEHDQAIAAAFYGFGLLAFVAVLLVPRVLWDV